MFNDKSYFEISHDEHFYGGLFTHALLASAQVRERFCALLHTKLKISLNPDVFDVYHDVHILKDYWRDLGDPVAYTGDTHSKRKAVLLSILSELALPAVLIDKHDFFYTREKKLWSPANWDEESVNRAGLSKLIGVKRAFNTRTHLFILSDGAGLLLEAHLESPESRHHGQQPMIGRLLRLLVPELAEVQLYSTVLDVNPSDGLAWKDLLNIIDGSEVDMFTQTSLAQLKKYYR